MADHPTRDDIDLCSGAFWAGDHHAALTWMRANAPVYWDGIVWGVTRYDDVKAVSKDPGTFSSAGGIRPQNPALPMMIDMDDPAHLKRRMLVNKGFTPRRVRDSEPAVQRACTEILDAVCERGEADLVSDVAAHLPMIMIGDALGVRPEDRADLLRWSDDMLKGLSTEATPEQLEATTAAFTEYVAYAHAVIADRQQAPRDDLMSILVHAEVDGERLTADEIVQESLLILIGGDETTRHVISGGVHQLLCNPDQWKRVAEDPELRPSAVEEMLRWVTPIKNMVRTATRDVELGGQQVHEGDELMLLYPSANRDEAVFEDPFRFDVGRTPNEHVAFGFGPHFCLGASLARLEISVMLDQLLDRLPDLALVDPDAEPELRPANFVSGIEALPVRFTPTAKAG
ncbi:MAG TPA: cytochrome P450 [Acidimicrobiales bacterium]|nr:cytochrome P450 [Acidimicrobiales bacterium]